MLENNYTGITKLKDWWGKVKGNFQYLDGKIDSNFEQLDDRISTIITTPVDGVSAQEIIDARKGELALGDKIDAMDLEVSTHLAEYAIHLTHYTKTVGVLVESTNGLDDTIRIQTAIKYCFDNNIAYLSFEPNKTYLLDNATTDCSIIFYGKNLTVLGNDATLKKINPALGYHGDVMDIYGLVNGTRYPLIGDYAGENITAENILIENLNVEASNDVPTGCNNIGIVNVENVTLRNVKSINAPSGGFVVVTENELLPNDKVVFENCHAIDCRELSYRLTKVFADTGLGKNNLIMRNCTATGLKGIYPYGEAGVTGKRINLWYRQNLNVENPHLFLTLENCHFDENGQFAVTAGAGNLTVKNCSVEGGVYLAGLAGTTVKDNVIWEGGKIPCDVLKEGATTEQPIYGKYIRGLTCRDVEFGDTLNAGLPLGTNTLDFDNCEDVTFDNVKNLNLRMVTVTSNNKNVNILNSKLKMNNLQLESSSHMVLYFSGLDYLKIRDSKIENALMTFNTVIKLHFDHNDCYIDKNTGNGLLAKNADSKDFVATNNTLTIGANSTNSLRMLTPGDGFVDENNVTICNDGTYRSRVMYRTATPISGGYYFVGDRIINSVPTVGQPKAWTCTTSGVGGTATWVSEGNL